MTAIQITEHYVSINVSNNKDACPELKNQSPNLDHRLPLQKYDKLGYVLTGIFIFPFPLGYAWDTGSLVQSTAFGPTTSIIESEIFLAVLKAQLWVELAKWWASQQQPRLILTSLYV
ncbi:hypothetical protein RND71_038445 [Anisodus tanguticus]|uniref:Uncharacterized protein n=1 Tax=Anisodus tanguticus TaxID=243964 RepID=A0AAE1QZ24_9SOLA|nr:hypothetical protein RND71_038445 [Anisodus tanguticus]